MRFSCSVSLSRTATAGAPPTRTRGACAGRRSGHHSFISVMNRYTLTKKLGDGTYGSVLKAVNRQTGEEVAVKKMKKLFTRQARTHCIPKRFPSSEQKPITIDMWLLSCWPKPYGSLG